MGSEASKVSLPSNLDLIEITQAEYDFLRLVDQHPALYCKNVLKNAVHRYENYWLPLASKYEELLVAPLDIEWVWHCHILNPVAYQRDCIKLVGKVIDHAPMFLTTGNKQHAEKYWLAEYPDVDYEIDLTVTKPAVISTEAFRCSYNIVAGAQRHKDFIRNITFQHFRSAKYLRTAAMHYWKALCVKNKNLSTHVLPYSYAIDLILHSHQQYVLLYRLDLKFILGKILNLNDSMSDDNHVILEKLVTATQKRILSITATSGFLHRGPHSYLHQYNLSPLIKPSTLSLVSIHIEDFHQKQYPETFIEVNFIFRLVLNCSKGEVVAEYSKTYRIENGCLAVTLLHDEICLKYQLGSSLEITCDCPIIQKSYKGSFTIANSTGRSCHIDNKPVLIYLRCTTDEEELIRCKIKLHTNEYAEPRIFDIREANQWFHDIHLKNIFTCLHMTVPKALRMKEVHCWYYDQVFTESSHSLPFTMRLVHSKKPLLSAIEVRASDGTVTATSHSIGHSSSSLIRGRKGDWGLLKIGRNKKYRHFRLEVKLFTLYGTKTEENFYLENKSKLSWSTEQGIGNVDLNLRKITLSASVRDVAEFLCIGFFLIAKLRHWLRRDKKRCNVK